MPVKPIDKSVTISDDIANLCSHALPWVSLQSKTILVTGGGGFIGSYVVKTFLYLSHHLNLNLTIVCVVRNAMSARLRLQECLNFENFIIFEQDMNSPLVPSFPRADIIIHAASQAAPRLYGSDPVGTLSSNIIGTINLLTRSLAFPVEQFLFISSGEVYGEQEDCDTEITEESFGFLDPTQVRSCYGESKRMAENICVSFFHQYGVDARIVRPFHTYGPGLSNKDGRVFADFIHAAARGEDILIKSDGLARRPFCYITDAISGILHVLLKGEAAEAYNVANPSGDLSVSELAEVVINTRPELGLSVKKIQAEAGYLKSPIPKQVVNVDKLLGLGWTPQVGAQEGFMRAVTAEKQLLN